MKVRYDRTALRRLRAARGLDLKGLAAAIGTTKQNAWMLDAGRQEPRASTLAKLAAALGADPSEFFVVAGK
jgi:transcriptional regulator with XRE-family HTH domain